MRSTTVSGPRLAEKRCGPFWKSPERTTRQRGSGSLERADDALAAAVGHPALARRRARRRRRACRARSRGCRRRGRRASPSARRGSAPSPPEALASPASRPRAAGRCRGTRAAAPPAAAPTRGRAPAARSPPRPRWSRPPCAFQPPRGSIGCRQGGASSTYSRALPSGRSTVAS